jgi:hypothetical protein
MNRQGLSYSEELLQWIWKQREFAAANLKSVSGERIEIIDPGEWNRGEGPDFLGACISIGGLIWHGSVEVHHHAAEWYSHGHHTDPNYNNTILHVVLAGVHKKVNTLSGSEPAVLDLSEYLSEALHKLLRIKNSRELNCAGNVAFLNQEAFTAQIKKAHREYFEFKSQELLSGYDPALPPSAAWKTALAASIYSTLGIPRNREPMAELFQCLRNLGPDPGKTGADLFPDAVARIAFGKRNRIAWRMGGMRPASRPEVRVKEAAALHYVISASAMDMYLERGVRLWPQLLKQVPEKLRPGKQMCDLLKSTVFIPAVGLLGDLFHSKKLKEEAFRSWMELSGMVPAEVQKPFREAGFTLSRDTNRPGLAHQYKRYCREQQCHRCEVFKSAIRS